MVVVAGEPAIEAPARGLVCDLAKGFSDAPKLVRFCACWGERVGRGDPFLMGGDLDFLEGL